MVNGGLYMVVVADVHIGYAPQLQVSALGNTHTATADNVIDGMVWHLSASIEVMVAGAVHHVLGGCVQYGHHVF